MKTRDNRKTSRDILLYLKISFGQSKRIQSSLLGTISNLKRLSQELLSSDDSLTVQAATSSVLKEYKMKKI